MHLMAAGDGTPAVVIVPALSECVIGWVPVWRELAESARVCVYDRAGIAWSDPPSRGRRTFDDFADELHDTLAAARIGPPYLVVGHSLGGIIARRFAARYPGDMAGLVLVDSSHEDQNRRLGTAGRHLRSTAQLALQPFGLRRLVASAGLNRRLKAQLDHYVPAEYRAEQRAVWLSSRERRAMIRETLLLIRSRSQPPDLGSLPLTVLTAAKPDPTWKQLQAELAAASAQGQQVTADRAGHYIQVDEPELVIKAIRDLLAVDQSGSP
jgi:pimeloyl-ACP methyl ester carboxylesterase